MLVLLLVLAAAFTFFRGMVSAGRLQGGVPWVPWGGRGGRIHPAVPRIPTLPPQVILDCPADSCFEYIYQHEPYLRDPVAYPKVQVRVAQGG